MSFNFSAHGTKAQVLASLQADTTVPSDVKTLLEGRINATADDATITTNSHEADPPGGPNLNINLSVHVKH